MSRVFPMSVGAPPVHTPSHPLSAKADSVPCPHRVQQAQWEQWQCPNACCQRDRVVPSGSKLRYWGHWSWVGDALSLKVHQG